MRRTRTKKVNQSNITRGTLDQKHKEKIQLFQDNNKSLPSKKDKLSLYERELAFILQTDPKDYTGEDISRKIEIVDKIRKLREHIKSIENCTNQLDYICKTLPILVDYYGSEVDNSQPEEYIDVNVNDKNDIRSYFMPKQKPINDKSTDPTKNKTTKASLYENYLEVTNGTKRKRKTDVYVSECELCGAQRLLNQIEGTLICKKCGLSEREIIFTDKPSYKEPTPDPNTYAYKRNNHLSEILSQLQAKESTDIPQEVFDKIFADIKKRNINIYDLDMFHLRRILKRLGERKYYEHVPHILQIINGKEPPSFSREAEATIKKMFKDIQKPFSIYCPKERKNFLNYSYVLHKFCELLDLDEYLSYFPLLKNNSKLLQHDKIWKNICEYMKWQYHKSI